MQQALAEKSTAPSNAHDIGLLSDESGVALVEVHTVFPDESSHLGMGAKVGSYAKVLTAANVRGTLQRLARRADAAEANAATRDGPAS